MTSIRDIIGIAYHLEGEGCFCSEIVKDKYRYFDISVNSIDEDIIRRAAKILHKDVTKYSCRDRYKERAGVKKQFSCTLSGDKAIGWMMTIYPLMGERRRAKIREIISEWKDYHKELSNRKLYCKKGHLFEGYNSTHLYRMGRIHRYCRICRLENARKWRAKNG